MGRKSKKRRFMNSGLKKGSTLSIIQSRRKKQKKSKSSRRIKWKTKSKLKGTAK
jgi:hypothetical protein